MPNQCSQIKKEYGEIKDLKEEFVFEFQKLKEMGYKEAEKTGQLLLVKKLQAELEQKRNALFEKFWTFENLSQKEFEEQYNDQTALCKETGFLQPLSNGQEGIKDEQGKEYPMPTLREIMAALRKNELYREKIETFENPYILITPFALSPEKMAKEYGKQIERHFVEERIEGDRRIPDKNKTKLFGVNKDPLELRTDKDNVYFNSDLENILYFPEWREKKGKVKPSGGITKQEAIIKINGWAISIIEGIPLAPGAGQGKEFRKTIKINGKEKEIFRKQPEGGMNAAKQYQFLKQQREQGLTLEEQIYFSMLYLEKNNIVLDDNRKTNYYCCILGNNTASGDAPSAYWSRVFRQANLFSYGSEFSDSVFGVRGAVRVL